MPKKFSSDSNRLMIFLLSFLILFLAYPFFIDNQIGSALFATIISLVLISGIYAISDHRNTLIIGSLLGVIAIVFGIMQAFVSVDSWIVIAMLFSNLIFFAYTGFVIIREVIYLDESTAETIYGSIAGYMLLGMTGAMLFGLMEVFDPTSFNVDLGTEGFHIFLYYSFVTLSTLGYGDVTPTAPHAQAFAAGFSICGQLYLTVFVAMLVGKYLRK